MADPSLPVVLTRLIDDHERRDQLSNADRLRVDAEILRAVAALREFARRVEDARGKTTSSHRTLLAAEQLCARLKQPLRLVMVCTGTGVEAQAVDLEAPR